MEHAKIVVVGAGPAGIATAVEAKIAGIDPVVILEKRPHPCDTIVSLYHEGKRVDPVYRKMKVEPLGVLSFDTESREEFLERMNNVIKEYNLDVRYKEDVQKIVRDGDNLKVISSSGLEIEAPVVVVAIGVFGKPVKPSYKIPAKLKNKVLFSLPKEPPTGKKVLVVGGGDTAAETACYLADCGNEVYLSYRRPEFFRLNDINRKNIEEYAKNGKVKLMMATDIEGLDQENDHVVVHFKDGDDVAYDYVFYCLGGMTPAVFLEGCGVEMDGRKPKLSDDFYYESNVPGLFLAGDLVALKGSIMAAFNSGKRVVEGILKKYGDKVKDC